ncbi:VPA1269 family protein [Pseudomonas aeruginosa]
MTKSSSFASLGDAKIIVREQCIRTISEYKVYARTDSRLPAQPCRTYAGKGWVDWYDFVGAERNILYEEYEEAKDSISGLSLKTSREYLIRCNKDPRLPRAPWQKFKDSGWVGWQSFLGNPGVYSSYLDSKLVASELKIKGKSDYCVKRKLDRRLPRFPDKEYAGRGWISWDDFLGIVKLEKYNDYGGAQSSAQALGMETAREYISRYKEDPRLPFNPKKAYEGRGWVSWAVFLGKTECYSSYETAQVAVQMLGIKSSDDYRALYRLDPKLPCHPENTYIDSWSGWQLFLGMRSSRLYAHYVDAAAGAQQLGVRTRAEYSRRYKEDPSLPSNPNQIYKNSGWAGWANFLALPIVYSKYLDARNSAIRFGFRSRAEYQRDYIKDPRLPRCPDKVFAEAGWIGWPEFLNLSVFYDDYIGASAAAKALGIRSRTEYLQRYRDDPKLPSSPSYVYSGRGWVDWYDYLGLVRRRYYDSLSKTKLAVAHLGIVSVEDYRKRYREDPYLPATPDILYADAGWISWNDLLGREVVEFYVSYYEAQKAAQRLNLGGGRGRDAYLRCYRDDPKLPSCPHKVYENKGWVGWPEFLGGVRRDIYQSYVEARTATRSLGIKTSFDYKLRYREDPRLPATPYTVYRDIGWVDWYDFLGANLRTIDVTPQFPNIWSCVERWLEDEIGLTHKISNMKAFLGGYYSLLGYPDDVRYILVRSNPFDAEAYQQFIDSQAVTMRKVMHSVIESFFRWALDEFCTDEDDDERVILSGCRSPFETVLAGYSASLHHPRPTQSTKPPLGYEYILRAREYLVPNGESALITRPALKDMDHLRSLFGSRADWLEVPENVIDHDDAHCVWRKRRVLRELEGYKQNVDICEVWSPVRFIALYTLLRYPARGQQIVWLDGGESDEWIPVLDDGPLGVRWVLNAGPLAGAEFGRSRPRGVLQRGHDDIPCAYINTNKTGRSVGGYEVEWVPDDLVYWFIILRDWQSKYNPISAPTRWTDISTPQKINKKILQARGTQCFLFRVDGTGQPLSTAMAFVETLPALLYRIQRDGERLAKVDNTKVRRFVSPYTPHCLRVSLITAYIADGDAPIHVISKLVGHASLVMTIYYIRMSNDQMRLAMGEAEKRAAHKAFQRTANMVRSNGLEPLRPQLIATDGNRLLIESDMPASACVIFDWGICPMSASCCHIGAEASNERQSETIYIPVEAGYLGRKNCLRCRFLVTGVPFLGGLVALANEISLEIHTESGRYQELSKEVEALEQIHYDDCQLGQPFLQFDKLKSASANMQQSADKLDNLLSDYSSAVHFVQAAIKIVNYNEGKSKDDEPIKLISSSGMFGMQACFEESSTNYHLLAEICQNATVYHFSNPSRALPLISQAIDKMAENNNLKPAMFRLDDAQKLVVVNQLNSLLMQRLGSWERIDDLFSGGLMLLDIDAHEPSLIRISTEIENLLAFGDVRQIVDTVPSDE